MLRLEEDDIIFEQDLTDSYNNEDEVVGYLWATDKLVELAGGFEKQDDDDYINFYPILNMKTGEFYVVTSITHEKEERRIDLTTEESDFIKTKFKDYYKDDLE